jgi:diphthine synthase
MLYIIGLGLADERDISTRGLEVVRKADRVYLEAYTAVLLVEKEELVGHHLISSSLPHGMSLVR